MIINEIQLTNIGAYRGSNSFDFRPLKDKNVILIGGENGAGKTTLLNAIKLGLFGSYGYGFKTENAEYYKRVQSMLNHGAKRIGENNFRIKLEFSLVDDFEKVDYILYRYWNFKNQSLKESFDLIANGKHLSDYEKDLFQSKLKEVMPPQLLDLCLFDGEEISRIVNKDLLSEYLSNLSRVVFNLDLFEKLEDDLDSYSNQSLDLEKMESLEKELYTLNQSEKELRANIVVAIEKEKELSSSREQLNDEYQRLKYDFENYGGLIKDERENIIRQMNVIEATRKQNMEKIRNFVSNTLPFYLSKNLLSETREQIQSEESMQLSKQLNVKLTDENMKDLLSSILGSYEASTGQVLKEKLLKLVKPEIDIQQIHGASFSESSLVENAFLKVSSNSKEEYLNIIEENRTRLTEHQALREKLTVNDNTNEFSDMIQQMENIQHNIIILDQQIVEHETQLQKWKDDIEVIINAINKIQHSLKDNDKTKSSFLESQKIITLSRRFREIQLKKKLQQVQFEATSMLKRIFRKHNYVSSIYVDYETYDVILYDSQKEKIEKTTLSAGEKEILLISIIWAIFKCSGRKVPFIFDTLLGRLDKTHKAAVLSEFIPNCGRQAIILSTDSEIDLQHYSLLEKIVAKEYMLEFNVEKQETRILDRYFPFKQMELGI
ncbi:DNA sulfur modification protein DndD [Neobacillus sp. M.A.Huq-85]